jgi:hypothetical protein
MLRMADLPTQGIMPETVCEDQGIHSRTLR